MRILTIPFQHVHAMADIDAQEIYVGNKIFSDLLNNLNHEFCHLISGDPDHGKRFAEQSDAFNIKCPTNDTFKNMRKRLGIKPSIAANIGNISGIQNVLTDYHLLQAYRKFSQKVLGTEGHWEVINEGRSNVEGDSLSAKDQLIRLYPTPKGAFPVVVLYIPIVNHFRSPSARMICYEMMEAEMKCTVGMSRRKITGMPTPDGGTISYDGSDLVQEGIEQKEKTIEKAINLGEPLMVHIW